MGECQRNAIWMKDNCKISCGTCNRGMSQRQFQSQSQQRNMAMSQRQFQSQTQQQSAVFVPSMSPMMMAQVEPQAFMVSGNCAGRVQTVERSTRVVPTGVEYRNRAFRMGCAVPNQPNICARNICFHERFRTFDGSCNNLKESTRGAAYTPYARLLGANYEDGVNRMVGTTPGSEPNPRDVTHLLLSTRVAIPTAFNALLMQFGQFLSHDITRNTIINTCSCKTVSPQCANMPIPRHDAKQGQCIPLTRSLPLCGTGSSGGMTPKTTMNENTAFIDASQIYGSDPRTANDLRIGALLKTAAVRNLIFPPPSMGSDNIVTGDSRSNLFIGLAALHTIFVRLHNRVALSLAKLNPHWDEERVYQEARKIIGAVNQVITYQEFLPALLGNKFEELIPAYKGFNPDVEPAISNEFASAAYRLHGLIREFYRLVDKNFRPVGDIRFVDGTGSVTKLLSSGTDLFIRGMITVASKRPQRLTSQVTEELFSLSDMGSLNIQRGRDHGLQSYMEYRRLCGLPIFKTFGEWEAEVKNKDVIRRVFELYGDPAKIDLYVGGLLEEPVGNSLLGPTFSCIIAEQFKRTRDGDRFFYLNPRMYTPEQTAALKRLTFAWIICETGEDFDRIRPNAFLVDNGSNAVDCRSTEIPKLDLRPWIEAQ